MEAIRFTSEDTLQAMFFKIYTLHDRVMRAVQNAFSTERICHFVGSLTAVSVDATAKHRHIFKETAVAVQKID